MKYTSFIWLFCIALFISCGDDNDDIVLPEDIINLDREEGITFGSVDIECTSNCITTYKISNAGAFASNASGASTSNPDNVVFADCPFSEETRFVSQIEGINNLPRGIRDLPSVDLSEAITNEVFPTLYFVQYTVSGIRRTVTFANSSSTNDQISSYLGSVITIVESLSSLDTSSPTTCTVML